MLRTICAILLLTICLSAHAIFCPNNFSSINYGDALASVISTCGQPQSQRSYMKKDYASQEWVYYVREGYRKSTSKLSIIISNDQVVNITLTGNEDVCAPMTGRGTKNPCIPMTAERSKSLSSTSLCGGYITVGNASSAIVAACGKPVFTNIEQGLPDKETPVTILQYSGPPVTQLIFENGVLINRIQGNTP